MASREVVIIIKADDKASAQIKQVGSAFDKITGVKLDPISNAIVNIGKVAAAAAIGGVAALGAGLIALAKTSVDTAAAFEQKMADAAAIMQMPIDQMGELREAAMAAAIDPNFRVTAIQAAEAIEMLARNGVKANQILGESGMLRGTILLANSVGTDLSTAADIATDALNIFNLEASDMVTAVNQITGVVNNSKFTINDYFLALGRGGASLAPLGGSFQEFNASLALIAPYFNSGQRAGTSLANFFNRLIPTTNKAQEAMVRLGMATIVTAEDGSTSFVNNFIDPATGELKEMTKVIEILQSTMGSMNAEDQMEAILQIFGRDAQGAIAALLQFGDEYEDMVAALEGTDAFESAATRMGTLAGATDVLKGFVESLRITIGSALLPILTFLAVKLQGLVGMIIDHVEPAFEAVRRISGDMFDAIDNGIDPIQAIMTAFGRFALMLGYSAGEVTALKLKVATLVDFFRGAGSDLSLKEKFLKAGETLLAPDQYQMLKDITEWLVKIKDAVKSFVDSGGPQKLLEFFGALAARAGFLIVLGKVVKLFTTLAAIASFLATPLGMLASVVALMAVAWQQNWGDIQGITQTAIDTVIEKWGELKVWWEENGGPIAAAWETLKENFAMSMERIPFIIENLVEAFDELKQGGSLADFFSTLFGQAILIPDDLVTDMSAFFSTVWTAVFGPMWEDTVKPELVELWGKFVEWLTSGGLGETMATLSSLNIFGSIMQAIFDTTGLEETSGGEVATNILTWLADKMGAAASETDWSTVATSVFGALKLAWDEVIVPNAASFVETLTNNMSEWDWSVWALDFTGTMVQAIFDKYTEVILQRDPQELWTPWKTLFQSIIEGEDIKTVGSNLLAAIVNGFLLNIDEKVQDFVNFTSAINTWVDENPNLFEGIGEKMMEIFLTAIWAYITAPWRILKFMYDFISGINLWVDGNEEDVNNLGEKVAKFVLDGIKWILVDGPNLWELLALFATTLKDWFLSEERPWRSGGDTVGTRIGEGIITGIENIWGAVTAAISGLATGAIQALKDLLGIQSPSKVTMEMGVQLGQGFVNGLSEAKTMAESAAVTLANGLTTSITPTINPSSFGPQIAAGLAAETIVVHHTVDHRILITDDTTELSRLVNRAVTDTVRKEFANQGRKVAVAGRSGLR